MEGYGHRIFRRTERIAYLKIRYTGYRNYLSDRRLLYIHLFQSLKLIELAYLYFLSAALVVMVHYHGLLVQLYRAVVHLAYAYASHIFVIVYSGDQYLQRSIRISLWCGDIGYYRIKERCHVFALLCRVHRRRAVLCGSKYERTVKLDIRCAQIHEKLQYLVHYFIRSRTVSVYLIHTGYHRQIK